MKPRKKAIDGMPESFKTSYRVLSFEGRKKRIYNPSTSRKSTCEACRRSKRKCEASSEQSGSCRNCIKRQVWCSNAVGAALERSDSSKSRVPVLSLLDEDSSGSDKLSSVDHRLDTDWLDYFLDQESTFLDFGDLGSIVRPAGSNVTPRTESETSETRSLCYKSCSGVHYGLLGEYDPILRERFFRYDENDECTFERKFFRLLSSKGSNSKNNGAALFAFKQVAETTRENFHFVRLEYDLNHYLQQADSLRQYISNIVVLFVKNVLPALPILDGDSINRLFTCESPLEWPEEFSSNLWILLLYRLVFPFLAYDTAIPQVGVDIRKDDPLGFFYDDEVLFTVIHQQITKELTIPTLTTLKSLIVFYHLVTFKKSGHITPFESSILGTITTTAYSLGLHLDPGSWNIPKHEANLRRRLWYTIILLEKWNRTASSLPSTIIHFDCLTFETAQDAFDDIDDVLEESSVRAFSLALQLTKVLDDFTACSSKGDPSERELAHFEELADQWSESYFKLELQYCVPYQCITLSYYVMKILINRVRYRSKEWNARSEKSYFTTCLSCFTEVVEFLSRLSNAKITCFWYNFSRSQFLYIRDIMLIAILTAENKEQSLKVFLQVKTFKGWLETHSKELEITLPALIRINITIASLGKQLKVQRKEQVSNLY